jgi:hypothetical protein
LLAAEASIKSTAAANSEKVTSAVNFPPATTLKMAPRSITATQTCGNRAPARAIAASISSPMREVSPADWAPWSLMSAGAVVMLYTVTIPRKMSG